MEGDKIVVTDDKHRYEVNADDEAPNQFGINSGMTYREAYNQNKLTVRDDNVEGESYGLHGHLYVIGD